jgi:hypothetical protein
MVILWFHVIHVTHLTLWQKEWSSLLCSLVSMLLFCVKIWNLFFRWQSLHHGFYVFCHIVWCLVKVAVWNSKPTEVGSSIWSTSINSRHHSSFFNKSLLSKKLRTKSQRKKHSHKEDASGMNEVENAAIEDLVLAVSRVNTLDSTPSSISFGCRNTKGMSFVPRAVQCGKGSNSGFSVTKRY